jgi:cytochrome P450
MDDNKRFRKYVDDQAAHRIALEKSGQGSYDIFKLLLDYKDKATGESMQFKELSDEAVVLIIAGKFCFVGERTPRDIMITTD